MLRQTKIVATIGPASRDPRELQRMIAAGMDVARLNFAHGAPDEHAETVERLRAAAEAVGREIGILQDVPGPKLRIGPVAGGTVRLHTGSQIVLTPEQVEGSPERLSVAWPGLAEIMSPDDVAYLADGAIRLRGGTQALGGFGVLPRLAVREVQAGHVHPRGDHPLELARLATGRPDRRDDLCLSTHQPLGIPGSGLGSGPR